jgi:hypothetical protein
MKNIFLILVVIFLVSCVAKRIPYEPDVSITNENAKAVIEQVLSEQPPRICPETTIIAEDYIELNYGSQTRSSDRSAGVIVFDGFLIGSGETTHTTKELKKRIYYNSILECKIFIRGSWHIAQIIDTEQRIIQNFYCRNEIKAKKFADAMLSLKKNVKNPLEK